ncbi:MAG: cobalamin biosynthesis protein P47K [Planctomycetaceae bacterium]|jgi:G3E family GTPase|nr:cobalamin biosynthesis protein P47K [Planctomycetaceae bacterium]MBT7256773.1 cobalamin biosynthesis protein P47K [Planctomycetaceae bacterium]
MRFVMIGGFLGAGKTTTIGKLAQLYQQTGLKVGIVTNDQATDLVDTHTLRNQGFSVGEVAGACFCCNFDELTTTVEQLQSNQQPDIILAEPVGSCTDLVATVVQPLIKFHNNIFDVAPYGVILKPSHGRRILGGDVNAGFSPEAAYIFNKQLEEADYLIVNRIDELSPDAIDNLVGLLQNRHPHTPIIKLSAKTGTGMQALVDFLDAQSDTNSPTTPVGQHILELDYDRYALGEAELGWLNATVTLQGDEKVALDDLLLDIIGRLQTMFTSENAETAHLKAIGSTADRHAIANLVGSDTVVELSHASNVETDRVAMIINARVAMDPAVLEPLVREAVAEACGDRNMTAEFGEVQSFRPGRPVPTHRIAAVGD